MANARITKKYHTRFLADFFVECTHDAAWEAKLKGLELEGKLDTAVEGFPEVFGDMYPETDGMNLHYCIERVELAAIPRAASCWWPISAETEFFMCYPADFPQSAVYMAIDFEDHDCGDDACDNEGCGHAH
ncbi:hypothetical protein [Parathalassolituus penaei]|uniref:Uncharacterized protein n=1 Tax=Parathalassolituus penaei TaxID=2997323 RepID=A0A9X3ISA0_9GAMM|nr:hypothetical protein [Parathalassolituus penaei]MCY0964674.1 hypothetical protein [Parathalassolituus penaei]